MSTQSAMIALISIVASTAAFSARAESIRQPGDLVGVWELAVQPRGDSCRIFLQQQKSDKGDYFVGVPPACRHAMPAFAKLGRWALTDSTHVTLDDPSGTPLLRLEAQGDAFSGTAAGKTYVLRPMERSGRSVTNGMSPTNVVAPVSLLPGSSSPAGAPVVVPVARKTRPAAEPAESKSDLAGRYAVMREKRDTGCMLTLDLTRGRGGDRAQLAPGCRDQGIVIFDPSAWQIVNGELVLTARAGHKTRLLKDGVGAWKKDIKDGSKPLGLKKL